MTLTFARLAGAAVLATIGFGGRLATAADKPVVVIETSMGNITVELEPERTPKTVANFLKYVDKEFYNGTVFHRVMGPSARTPDGFMIQGGGMTSDLKEKKTDKPVPNESLAKNDKGISNMRGTIAMARTPDPDSATSQFFVNLADRNKFLDGPPQAPDGYTAFGRVIEGMDVVDKIAKVETGEALLTDSEGRRNQAADVPVKVVTIKSIKRKAAK
jgi:cyclophilin family peptidyl-prolyl cis-trans isomerase